MKYFYIFLFCLLVEGSLSAQTLTPRTDDTTTPLDERLAVGKTLSIPYGPSPNLYGGLGREGSLFYNTSDKLLYVYKGTEGWKPLANNESLANYLPVTGGTLTGALTGTNATFSGNASIAGKLLIGTASPTLPVSIFNVVGSGVAASFTTNTNNSDALYVQSSTNQGFSSIGFLDESNTQKGSVGFANSSAGGAFGGKVFLNSTSEIVFGINSLEKVRIAGNGNVGIGTTNPSTKLNVEGDFGNTGEQGVKIRNINPSGYSELIFDNNNAQSGGAFVFGYGGTGTPYANQAYFNNKRNAEMAFATNNLERFRIAGNGNIGIGTKTPSAKLDIEGDFGTGWGQGLKLRNTNASGYSELVFNNNNAQSEGGFVLGFAGTTTPYADQVYLWNRRNAAITFGSNNLERMRIAGNGNIGIGTQNPSTKLDIEGDFGNTGGQGLKVRNTNASGYSELVFNNNTTDSNGGFVLGYGGTNTPYPNQAYFNNRRNAEMAFATNNLERFRISGNGNVGIGTTNPSTKLDIEGDFGTGWGQGLKVRNTNASGYSELVFNNNNAQSEGGFVLGFAGTTTPYADQVYLWNRRNAAITFGSNNLERMRIAGNGNIGIGTQNPSTKLDIEGDFGNTAGQGIKIRNTNVSGYSELVFNNNDAQSDGAFVFGYGGTGTAYPNQAYFNNRRNAEMAFATNNLERFRIAGNGNVGIGTKTPSTKLDIEGDFGTGWGQGLKVRNTNPSGYSELVFNNNNTQSEGGFVLGFGGTTTPYADQVYLWNRRNAAITFGSNNLERMRIAGNGNIGIGTQTPSTKLDIEGDFGSAAGQGIKIRNTNPLGYSELVFNNNSAQSDGAFVFGFGGTGTVNPNQAYFWNRRDAPILFGTNSLERLRISANGKIGIGTTNPLYPLNVVSSGVAATFTTSTNTSDALYVQSSTNNGFSSIGFLDENNNQKGSVGFANSSAGGSLGGKVFLNANNKQLAFSVTGGVSYAALFDINGNFGLGVNSPSSILHLKAGTAAAKTAPLKLTAGTSLATPEAGAVEFDGNRLYFTPAGERKTIAFTSDLSTAGLGYTAANDEDVVHKTGDETIAGTKIITGNLGLGINPTTKLDLEGDFGIYGGQGIKIRNTNANGYSELVFNNNNAQSEGAFVFGYGGTGTANANQGYFWNRRNAEILFGTNNLERVRITGNGYVGIGTGNATLVNALTVNGNILTKGIKVNPESVPDYVFKPEYKLRPLEEVERFVKANSHLPEVPSESEVKKNGLELGEMSTTLLKKVEELTLYLIEIKKENENLKQRLEKLERNK